MVRVEQPTFVNELAFQTHASQCKTAGPVHSSSEALRRSEVARREDLVHRQGLYRVCQSDHMSSECEKINVLPVSNTTSVRAKRDRCTAVLFQRRYIGEEAGGTRDRFCKCKLTCVFPIDSTIMLPNTVDVVTSPLTETPVFAQEMVTVVSAGRCPVFHGRTARPGGSPPERPRKYPTCLL